MDTPNNTEEKIIYSGYPRDRMLQYMNNKYKEDNFYYASSGGDSSSILVKSDKFPDERIVVLYSYDYDNKADSFADNYIYYRYQDQFVPLIEEVLREAFDYDFKYFYRGAPSIAVFNTNDNATLEEFIAKRSSSLSFSVVFAPGFYIGDERAFEEKFSGIFAGRNIIIKDAYIYFPTENDGYDELAGNNLSKYIMRHKLNYVIALYAGKNDAKFIWNRR